MAKLNVMDLSGAAAGELEVADEVFFTDRGVIVEHGPPSTLFKSPSDPRLKDFLDKVL